MKHTKYFLLVDGKSVIYIKLESESAFSVSEAKQFLTEKYPKAKAITSIPKTTAEQFFHLMKP